MPLVKVYKSSPGCDEVGPRLRAQLSKACPDIKEVRQEACFYIKTTTKVTKWATLDHLEQQLKGKIRHILGDPWMSGDDLHPESQQVIQDPSTEFIIEVGPRLNFTTAYSTNAVGMVMAAGLKTINRIEKGRRYLIKLKTQVTQDIRDEISKQIHDPMTEQEYAAPLETFALESTPEPWFPVNVMEEGKKALQQVNDKMGLGFDDWDLSLYTTMFTTKMKRNPTSVELFDLAQSNSEHSRHWFFKGDYYVDGEKLPRSMLDMVMETNKHPNTNKNNVIAFSDNSSGMKGWSTLALLASDPTKESRLVLKELDRDLIFTAETHNFPTGVAPFSGATTGTGGRIRDVQAAGRGGHVVAGTAGYCFGNLHIPGYEQPWEFSAKYPASFATPLEVAIGASNGASDYGNKFGEPVICGFSRSLGTMLGDGKHTERREWVKPIMFSGGMGTIDHDMINKIPPKKGYTVVKIGGPVYRIGVGGGAASSVQVQGDNAMKRDLGAVQRGDAEMGQKLNRVIRGCIEMRPNPILSIHDQGAGGNANVLKELMEGSGGRIYTKSFRLGDPTLSTLEIWGAEYQESNAVLVDPDHLDQLQRLAERERCPIDAVGVLTDDQKVKLIEDTLDLSTWESKNPPQLEHPVDLELDMVLGKMPKKEFKWCRERITSKPLKFCHDVDVTEALNRVLRLPSVASKRFLTNKVDRSVTGLVAQQQGVGPMDTPLADVAVTAISFFQTKGTATSIGEQPFKILVDPAAGARMSVMEALSNLAAAPITCIKDVKCSSNWMWAAKLPGEGWAMYEACEAMCEVMKSLGIAVDGGKDSLSMAARVTEEDGSCSVVKAPGSLVVSTYAPCTDITKVVTPDLKGPSRGLATSLIWIRPVTAHARLGGTALLQVYSQVGKNSPDVDEQEIHTFVSAFNVIQDLIKSDRILSLHDISDGGLITCLYEMGMAGLSGFSVNIPPAAAPHSSFEDEMPPLLSALFSEEVGWVAEVKTENVDEVLKKFVGVGVVGTCLLGDTAVTGRHTKMEVSVNGVLATSHTVIEALNMWEETSYKLEEIQMNPNCAKSEFESFANRKHTPYNVPFTYKDFALDADIKSLSEVRVAVIREEGTNGDREMAAALIHAGFSVYDVTMTDILTDQVNLDNYKGLVFPGGFSYADVLGSGVGWAASILGREDLRNKLEEWKQREDTFSLGVCNGCQLLNLLGWLNPVDKQKSDPVLRLVENESGRFESRWSRVKIEDTRAILLKGMEGANLGVWTAHGEGRFVYKSKQIKATLETSACIAMRYVDDDNKPTEVYPMNPNGSEEGVAAVTSSCGRHLAVMPHPERCVLSWQWPYKAAPLLEEKSVASPWAKLFQNGLDWCLEQK